MSGYPRPVCTVCGKPIEEDERAVYTMGRIRHVRCQAQAHADELKRAVDEGLERRRREDEEKWRKAEGMEL